MKMSAETGGPRQFLPSAVVVPVAARLRHACYRWISILIMAALGGVAFELTLPFDWNFAGHIEPKFSPWFMEVTVWIVTFLMFYLLVEPIRIRSGQWSRIPWYPPLWLAVVLGWALAAASEHLPVDVRPQSVGPNWQQLSVVVPIVAAFVGAILARQLSRTPRGHRSVESARTITTKNHRMSREERSTWNRIHDWISDGEQPIKSSDTDLFDHEPISVRIARIVDQGRSVALIGPVGSGKSSILNLVRGQLDQSTVTNIVASFDVWAVPRSEDAPRIVLDGIIEALDDYVDTIGVRTLPVTYQRLVAAAPANLAKLLGVQSEGDSIGTLLRLRPILEALNARLVLIVEDVERTGTTFDTRHLQRFLWALREVPRTSFIFAHDPTQGPTVDYTKLCDTVELVPPMEYADIDAILTTAFGHWVSVYGDVDPRPDYRQSKLGLRHMQHDELFEYIQLTGRDMPIDHLVQLLRTPRHLKRALQRIDTTWQHLHGEADLEDIMIVTALRESAPSVYEFLLGHIDAARHESDESLRDTTTVKPDWDRLLESLSNGRAIQGLVDQLGIKQLSTSPALGDIKTPQGVHLSGSRDYFRRIISERLSLDELRDQTVLSDIDAWRQSRAGSLVGRLASASEGDRYPSTWAHFAARHADDELPELARDVATSVLKRDGSEAAAYHPALLALFGSCRDQLRRDQNREWLQALILQAVPVSLNFAIGFYRIWCGENGIPSVPM